MKQSSFSNNLISLFSDLTVGHTYVLDGFHPDYLLSLYHVLDVPVFFVLHDGLFDATLRYLSDIQNDEGVVFIPPTQNNALGPDGFFSPYMFQKNRSRELLSSGLAGISFIFCAESGADLPIVGSGRHNEFNLLSGDGFEECVDFLILNEYKKADMVFSPGEYCIRGGIIDVYPFSFARPVRLNFLGDVVDVMRLDVQSQIAEDRVKNFSIQPLSGDPPCSLKDCKMSKFITLSLNSRGVNIKDINPVGFSKVYTSLSYDQFITRQDGKCNNVFTDDCLTSLGVIDGLGESIVPPWFIKRSPSINLSTEKPINSPIEITNIKKGDYLVHRDHGVGVCMGLISTNTKDGVVQEFLSIQYSDNALIRLDSNRLGLVSYYAEAGTDGVELSSLKKRGLWIRRRRAAQRHAEETIERLLNLYVRRNDIIRSPFVSDVDLEFQFQKDFPHNDTDDQKSAWIDIVKDLSSNSPMDRLLCGDVGFGKTELALRATFRVVLGNKRVLVLAPTTILANQLYVSFRARLEPHAVNVEMVSRFRSKKNIKHILDKILLNKNDVLIGTHSILNDYIYLNNIGLLIIDEEHRFGVGQKEKIKLFKENIDVLSMSATPIPRSLNLALAGLYSISLLQTPPLMRRPIATRVCYYDDNLIKEAVLFEVERGGQVYFVHNNVQTIKHVADTLQNLFSDLLVLYIHGQESPGEVERKMDLFVSGCIHVLVCTSIIEAGIDVPNANCIIINNSHLFGLSQLYQIRGRVGRSYRHAYAYLLVPAGLKLSNRAFGRIKTIEENTRLGSGYNISRSDMELRGSGTLFGYKQSGCGSAVGYELYLQLIRRAISRLDGLQAGLTVLPEDVVIDVFEQRHIPEDYIPVESIRLSFYKGLSAAVNNNEIDKIVYNLTNRFGPIPASLCGLIQESQLRILAGRAGVVSIEGRGCGFVCKIIQNDSAEFIKAAINFSEEFFMKHKIDFHLLPGLGNNLSICIHLSNHIDKYSLFSQFLDKFKVLI